MKRSHVYIAAIFLLLIAAVICLYRPKPDPLVRDGYAGAAVAERFDALIAARNNRAGIRLTVDQAGWDPKEEPVIMNEERELMLPLSAVRELFGCNAAVYEGDTLKLFRNSFSLKARLSEMKAEVNGEERIYREAFERIGDIFYVSARMVADCLNYDLAFDDSKRLLTMNDRNPQSPRLPVAYDARTLQRTPQVRDQGSLGTCWAFAAVSAVEAALLPEEHEPFSADHMSLNNGYTRAQESGGEYTMAMSYLLAWQGVVYEKDDPYGDGKTDRSLEPVKHVQEIRIIPQKDLNGIKQAVYLYGAVQTSLYSALKNPSSISGYYNRENAAYYYVGTNKMNHDVLIVGWDDTYPRENFNTPPEGNGAFLCQNSWGTDFGDGGFFWVSYFDSSVGIYNIVYTGVEETDNYDRLYQSDLCGWAGQLGYGSDSAYFANVYSAESDENLEAVGFYAVDRNTEYEVYVIPEFNSVQDLKMISPAASGSFSIPGFYTVRLDRQWSLTEGKRFAVIVHIRTPGETRPVAVEYDSADGGVQADLTDGEGYISFRGKAWQSAETGQNCNLCLKAYTTKRTGSTHEREDN